MPVTLPDADPYEANLRQLPPDPLQHTQELIEHYDRNGYPERARYLERADQGDGLVHRLFAGDLSAVPDLFAWWTGSPMPAQLPAQLLREAQLAGALTAMGDAHAKIEHGLSRTRGQVLQALDDAVAQGVRARVNLYLQPLGPTIPTASSHVYELLTRVRGRLAGGRVLRLTMPLPPPHHDGVTDGHLIVCERCTFVDLRSRTSSRCRFCAHRKPLPAGAIRAPRVHPDSFLVAGERVVFAQACEVCGSPVLGKRGAQLHPGCRVKKHRAARQST